MKLTKKDLLEIIDSNGELIGKNDIPAVDANADTQANNTTDYNQKIGTQPFRYSMLGRFGFTLMPFMEGKENQEQQELLNDLAHLAYERYMEILEYYYRNPNKLKSDFRQMSEKDFNTQPEDKKNKNFECAKKMATIVQKHFENAFKEPETLDETKVVEDKVVDKKTEDEMSNKEDDKEVQEKKLEKIAGLINKLDKEAKDKLKNLLEAKETKEESEFSEEEKEKITDFVSNYVGDFKDEDIHKLGEKLGLDIPELEEFIYSIARKGLKK